MATEQRLIDANDALNKLRKAEQEMMVVSIVGYKAVPIDGVIQFLEKEPTVDAVEVSRLGELGRLMMPYRGCPRGEMGCRGGEYDVTKPTQLDLIRDVDGNCWVPVLLQELDELKDYARSSVPVVRCKDCKWWKTFGCWFHQPGKCTEREADDFCSDGERRTDNG